MERIGGNVVIGLVIFCLFVARCETVSKSPAQLFTECNWESISDNAKNFETLRLIHHKIEDNGTINQIWIDYARDGSTQKSDTLYVAIATIVNPNNITLKGISENAGNTRIEIVAINDSVAALSPTFGIDHMLLRKQ